MREKIARIIRDNTMALALSSHPHTSEKVADQILTLISEEIEKVEKDPEYILEGIGFEHCREKILALLK